MQGIKQIKLWRIIRNLTFVYFEKKTIFSVNFFFTYVYIVDIKNTENFFKTTKKK